MTTKSYIYHIRIVTLLIAQFLAIHNVTLADNGKIEISQSMLPLSITAPGSYILTESITGIPGTNGITIFTNNVTIDLNNFSLTGVAGTLSGIQSISNSINIKVINGYINNWGHDGIDMGFSKNCIFKSIISSNNERDGLNAGFGAIVADSTFIDNGPFPHDPGIDYGNGIEAEQSSTVSHCIAKGNNQHGIIAHSGSTVADCTMLNNGHDGVHGSHNIIVTRCSASGNDENLEMDSASMMSDSSVSYCKEDGIRIKRTGLGSGIIKNCTTFSNGKDGIDVDTGSIVIGCNSYNNTKHGIRVEPASQVINSVATYNGSSGIKLGGTDCRAENNTTFNNDTSNSGYGGIYTSSDATNCIIIKNYSDEYVIGVSNHFENILTHPTCPAR